MQTTLAKPDRTHPQERPILKALKLASSIHQVVERQAFERPDAVAVVAGEEKLTYAELNARANQAARALQTLGVRKDNFVAVYMERSAGTVVAILGILK